MNNDCARGQNLGHSKKMLSLYADGMLVMIQHFDIDAMVI